MGEFELFQTGNAEIRCLAAARVEIAYTRRMKINDAEATVIEHWGNFDREFARATEELFQALLWAFNVDSGPSSRCTDGLLPEYEEKLPEAYFGTAVLVFLPDQSVEPVSLDISFDPKVRRLGAAQIQFGWRDWNAAIFGDSRHSKMAGSLASMPRLERHWRWTFTRLEGVWTAQHLLASRDPVLWPPID